MPCVQSHSRFRSSRSRAKGPGTVGRAPSSRGGDAKPDASSLIGDRSSRLEPAAWARRRVSGRTEVVARMGYSTVWAARILSLCGSDGAWTRPFGWSNLVATGCCRAGAHVAFPTHCDSACRDCWEEARARPVCLGSHGESRRSPAHASRPAPDRGRAVPAWPAPACRGDLLAVPPLQRLWPAR